VVEQKPTQWEARNWAEVARFFGLRLDTVKHWRAELRAEGVEVGETKHWDLAAIARWRIEKANRQGAKNAKNGNGKNANGSGSGDGDRTEENFADPRDREKHYKAELARLELETRLGQRISRAEHEAALVERSGWFHEVLVALAGRLAPKLAHQPAGKCRKIIGKYARDVLRAAYGQKRNRPGAEAPRKAESQRRI
jgi:hypothetical protein